MTKKCIGCGIILQDINKEEKGYTPNIKNDYCMRCFRLKNYGELKKNDTIDEEKIINKINQKKGLVFFLIDYLNINEYTLNIFRKINLKKVLVISKVDVLRRDMKFTKITNWLKKEYKINEDIIFLSTNKNYGIKSIFKYMDLYNTKKAYITGITNAGKSTLINKILKENSIHKEIVTSNKPNTTLDFINLKIGDYEIIDTPGFTYQNMNNIINKEIKPITYNIKENTTISLNDEYELSFLNPTSITLYLTNTSNIKRKYKSIKGNIINTNLNQDIVIPGLGFINVKSPSKIIISENLKIELRNSCSGDYYE